MLHIDKVNDDDKSTFERQKLRSIQNDVTAITKGRNV